MKEVKDVIQLINETEQKKMQGDQKGILSFLLGKVLSELGLKYVLKVIKPTLCTQDAKGGWVVRNHPCHST